MAALELVHLAPPAPAPETAPAPEHSPVVLTATLIARLATLNAAARDLRAMGYKIVSESLRWKTVGDKRIGHTEFKGVMVCWEEFQR